MNLEQATTIRQGNITDKNFIFNSWLKEYRNSLFATANVSPFINQNGKADLHRLSVPDSIYYKHHAIIIQNLLESSYVLVLCNPENEDHIFGYIVYQPYNEHVIVHFLYIKSLYRRFGLAKKLLSDITDIKNKTIYASHMTEMASTYMMRNYKLIYSPYLLCELSTLPLDTTKGVKWN